jgi:hypothetical protein
VRDDQADLLPLVRLRHVLRRAARPELDDDVLAKAVFRHGERLLEHVSYVVVLGKEGIRHHDGEDDERRKTKTHI